MKINDSELFVQVLTKLREYYRLQQIESVRPLTQQEHIKLWIITIEVGYLWSIAVGKIFDELSRRTPTPYL